MPEALAETPHASDEVRSAASGELPSPEVMARIHRDPGFCKFRTSHEIVVEWDEKDGWTRGPIGRPSPIEMDAAAMVFHYGQSVFEGLKAFQQADGSVALFRPVDHAIRLQRSARRLAMPEMPTDMFVRACAELVAADLAWLPDGFEQSLYLRPVLFATETELGLRPSRSYRCTFMAYPADPCFGRDFRPLSALVSAEWARSVRGSTGESKCAGNYAASLLAKQIARAGGYDEVLWLDGVERRWVDEFSTMNAFFVWCDPDGGVTVTTPPCDGAIMQGITRDSVLTIARDLEISVKEEPSDIEVIRAAVRSGEITEIFASGTAGILVPVGRIGGGENDSVVGEGTEGPVTARLRRALLDMQHGFTTDTHNWLLTVKSLPSKMNCSRRANSLAG